MKCPGCQAEMKLVDFYDQPAYQCSDCVFQRVLPDGTIQDCCMSLKDGALTWRAPKDFEKYELGCILPGGANGV